MIPAYALIIGSMKSGTTTLFDYLAQHPQIAPCAEKEPCFFAYEERWSRGFEWFEGLFDFDPDGHAWAMEASTDYSKYPFCSDVPARLEASAPRTFKLIYVLRHPLRRIESHARHTSIFKRELETPSPREDHSLDAGVSPVSLAASSYASQLDQFEDFVDRGDLHLLTMEELVADPAGELRKVCDFLGIDASFGFPLGMHANQAVGKRAFDHPLWRRLRDMPVLKGVSRALVPVALRQRLRYMLSIKVEARGRFDLRPAEEADLLKTLATDLRRLRDRYGVDIERIWDIVI